MRASDPTIIANEQSPTSEPNLVDEKLGALAAHMGTKGAHGPERSPKHKKSHERHLNSYLPPSSKGRLAAVRPNTTSDCTTSEQQSTQPVVEDKSMVICFYCCGLFDQLREQQRFYAAYRFATRCCFQC